MPPKSTVKSAPVAQVNTEATAQVNTEATAQVNTEASIEALAVTANSVASEFTHRIAATVEKGFYRAGQHWPREGVDVDRAEYSDDQWAALEAEPMIVIKSL